MTTLGGAGPGARRRRAAAATALALLGVGVLVRVVGYFHRSTLWGDEAMLALNIAGRGMAGLAHPLDYAQVAPVPFLWAERLMVVVAGANEYALRVVPLLAGIGLLLALAALARHLLRPAEAVVAVGLAATAFPLIRYGAEVKPYSIDGLVSVVLTLLGLQVLAAAGSAPPWRRLAIGGAAALLLSIPSIFVAAAVLLVLAAEARGRRVRWRPVLLTASLWSAVAAGSYLLWYRASDHLPYMRQFWGATFLIPGTAEWFPRLGRGVAEEMCSLNCWRGLLNLAPVYALLTGLGAWLLARRAGPAASALFWLPLVLPFAASVLGRYPLATRLLLYGAPQLVVLVAVGLVAVAEWLRRRSGWLEPRWTLSAFLLPPVILTLTLAIDPPSDSGFSKEELRPLIQEVERRAADEPVYVYHRATPAWVFYTTDWRFPDRDRLAWAARLAGPDGPGFVNGPTRGPRRSADPELSRPRDGRLELLGSHSGSQGRQWQGYVPSLPDSGWADIEAQRMRQAATPGIWLVLADYAHGPQDDGATLLQAAGNVGLRVTFQDRRAEAAVYRLELGERSEAR